MICSTFANDRRLVSMRDAGKGTGRKREGKKKCNSVVAINTVCSPMGNTRTCQTFRKIIATERREAAGSIRAAFTTAS